MALIPKGASASQHRYHSDPAILRYAALQSPGTFRAFLVTRTAGLTFRFHCRMYGGARTNALGIGNNVCIGWHRLLLRHRPRDGSVVSSHHGMNDLQPEGHMASYIGRRKFLATLGGAVATWPLAARAEQPALPVVGFIRDGSADANARNVAAFRKGLNETGTVEGQTVTVEYHWLEGRHDRLPALMADLVRRQVAVIATAGNVPRTGGQSCNRDDPDRLWHRR